MKIQLANEEGEFLCGIMARQGNQGNVCLSESGKKFPAMNTC